MGASSRSELARKYSRPPMVPASEELRTFVVAMEREVSSWPQVQLKPMFGMTAIYRRGTIFGLLPKTRSIHSGDQVWLKFAKRSPALKNKLAAERRILPPSKPKGAQWYTLSEVKPEDFSLTVEWLARAHSAAK